MIVTVMNFGYGNIELEKSGIKEQSITAVERVPAAGKVVSKEEPLKKEISYKEIRCTELGFQLKVPAHMSIDTDYLPAFIRISSPDMDIKLSRERSPYGDIDGYFNTYLYKYILDSEYREANNISLITNEYRSINGIRTRILEFARKPAVTSREDQNEYTHALFITGEREFHSCFIRCSSQSRQKEVIQQILSSFRKLERSGELRFNTAFKPELPDWNAETRALYEKLSASDSIMWGIFYPNSITRDFTRIEDIEKKLGYKFPLTLHYIYLGHRFPMEGMRNARGQGKTVELTMQVMWNIKPGNTDNEKKNVNFDVIDGLYDGYLRQFARDAKAFGHPFIFRLNNEMNSTWVRYSGIALLCDPDVYIKVWRHIYDIFEEEGVRNAIWVFNPNDVDYPPLKWNSHISYYPGNKYVHMIGITGYNTGTYYRNLTGERWRSFREIYDPLNEKYSRLYGEFPWMITEFACSSVGGDKEKWIRDMFANIGRYKNLKAAVWWSYADFDYRKSKDGTPARRYWLDEKPEYLKAFREGLIR
ncbi:MAG TPA: glycosyl hydrolase [Clostridia bacterium]|nr:glycosyl hydrolase [Clostridia bacterium]